MHRLAVEKRVIIGDWSLITGRGVYKTGRGACEVLPLQTGAGGGKGFSHAEGGGATKSFHSLKGEGARKVSPCLEGGPPRRRIQMGVAALAETDPVCQMSQILITGPIALLK